MTEEEEQLNNATGLFEFEIQEDQILMVYEDDQGNTWEVPFEVWPP